MGQSSKKFQVRKRPADHAWQPDSEYRYAAVDIGSNGVRLLLSKVITTGAYCTYTKESLVRMPIRLGADVFSLGHISEQLSIQLQATMQAFKYLIEAYDPVAYRVCATSAMREAVNGPELTEQIHLRSGLNLQIISGSEEAEIIFASHVAENLAPDQAYLYIDVGGGSTELTYFANSRKLIARSFPIGTVRLLNEQVQDETWEEMHHWVLSQAPQGLNVQAIGSGGNMNKIFRLAGRPVGAPVTYAKLVKIDKLLNSYNIEERIRILFLRPDRADVIIHASRIFRSIMGWADIKNIYVPQFGLADGLVHLMHAEHVKQ